MTTEDFIIDLFCRVDDQMPDAQKHSQASLYPSEVVTIAILFALKGVGNRAFYRWLERDYRTLFPHLPSRTRLFRLFNTHRHWTKRFMAGSSLLGLIDTFGIELLHPRREGRSERQIGKKGLSNQRWIVGGKLCFVLNHLDLIVDWEVDTANVYDGSAFQEIAERNAARMVLFSDEGFVKQDWHPAVILNMEAIIQPKSWLSARPSFDTRVARYSSSAGRIETKFWRSNLELLGILIMSGFASEASGIRA